MATTTTENIDEQKQAPTVQMPQYNPPTMDYSAQDAMLDEIRRRNAEYASQVQTPEQQREIDAKTNRGRAFWLGANMFSNVLANAINVNGVTNGAPAMDWDNGTAERNRLYKTWQDADKQLKIDRQAAQKRYDDGMMDYYKLQAAAEQQKQKDARDLYNFQFQLDTKEADYERAKADEQAKYERGRADKEADTKAQWEHDEKMARIKANSSASAGRKKAAQPYIALGKDTQIPTEYEDDQTNVIWSIYDTMTRNKYKEDKDGNPIPVKGFLPAKTEKEANAYIKRNYDEAMKNDPDFAAFMYDYYNVGSKPTIGSETNVGRRNIYDMSMPMGYRDPKTGKKIYSGYTIDENGDFVPISANYNFGNNVRNLNGVKL